MKRTPVRIIKKKKAKVSAVKKSCADLKAMAAEIPPELADQNYQNLLRCISTEDVADFEKGKGEPYTHLYPFKDDPNFNRRIASKKEFYDTHFEKKSREDFKNIASISDNLCQDSIFELQPQQLFVRNFMSFQTPYNSLLLYHGLGTGKTCSAITVCEDMRGYLKQLGIKKRILVVASPAVQENFRVQLFDERKLKEIDGRWTIRACAGSRFIQEINPMNMSGLSRDRIIKQVKKIITQSYQFQGYIEFTNEINRILEHYNTKRGIVRALRKKYSNRMIVIDEIHNMRVTQTGKVKRSSENLLKLVSMTKGIKLLLLSATPIFNSPKEIVWLLNLMNMNDGRFPIADNEIFDSQDNFKVSAMGEEIGRDLLIRKARGYISYVRGENPFTFPYRVWPEEARNEASLSLLLKGGVWEYPTTQMNGQPLVAPIELIDLVVMDIGSYQSLGYGVIIHNLEARLKSRTGVSYTELDQPLQALNMVYPHIDLDTGITVSEIPTLYGKRGLTNTMDYDKKTKSNFAYKVHVKAQFGSIFSPKEIGKYSAKISYICNQILRSRGIILIYSQYIDGGAVPMALALEEIGFTRLGGPHKSLFKTRPSESIDALTMKRPISGAKFYPAKYIMITGDKDLTPNVSRELKAATSADNTDGKQVKVIIVSRAGSEGLDFKCIRQVHILDPWYNLNRQEQIVGRAVRNLSHCPLPYAQRNVELYLYGTLLKNKTIEAADLYVYRLAERKAKKIGAVTRVLKRSAVDCLLNRKALDFSLEAVDKVVTQHLASGPIINYRIGDRPNTAICDYTTCNYMCLPPPPIDELDESTYDETFIMMNLDKILQRIRDLFRERYIYKRIELLTSLTTAKSYPLDQIYMAITYLIEDRNEYITDMLGRAGRLVNIGEYYMFQPIELANKGLSRFERVHPISFKRRALVFELPDRIIPYSSEEGRSTKAETANMVLRELDEAFTNLQNPTAIGDEDKESWTKVAAWAIRNLTHFNRINREILIELAMHHAIDILDYDHKRDLLFQISKEDNVTALNKIIQGYFAQFIIETSEHKGIVIADFSQSDTNKPYRILVFDGAQWVGGQPARLAMRTGLSTALLNKFVVKDLQKLNNVIGFMSTFKSHIVYKTKRLALSRAGRPNKGQRCDRGEGKKVLIERINKALSPDGSSTKYALKKSTIISINGKTGKDIRQDSGNVQVKIGSFQLCIEGELLFRYFDRSNYRGKRWFFSAADASINNIIQLGR